MPRRPSQVAKQRPARRHALSPTAHSQPPPWLLWPHDTQPPDASAPPSLPSSGPTRASGPPRSDHTCATARQSSSAVKHEKRRRQDTTEAVDGGRTSFFPDQGHSCTQAMHVDARGECSTHPGKPLPNASAGGGVAVTSAAATQAAESHTVRRPICRASGDAAASRTGAGVASACETHRRLRPAVWLVQATATAVRQAISTRASRLAVGGADAIAMQR